MNLTNLFELQTIDTQLDAFQIEIAAIDSKIGQNGAVQSANQVVASIHNEIETHQMKLNLTMDEIERQRIKLAQSDSTLYSGKIQNPKELQDLQQEISYLKKSIADLEDNQLNQMIEMEELQNKMEQAKQSLNGIASQFETDQSQLSARKENLQANSERLLRKREVVLVSIESDLLARYDGLRKRKNGLAVAALDNDSCSACGTQLTPSERQEVHQPSKLFFCPTCGRILYHK